MNIIPKITDFNKTTYELNTSRQSISFSNSPNLNHIFNLKKSISNFYDSPKNKPSFNEIKTLHIKRNPLKIKKLRIPKKHNIENNTILNENLGEKIKIKKILNDLISFGNKNNISDIDNGKSIKSVLDLNKFQISRLNLNRINNPELIPFIKFNEKAKKQESVILTNEKRLNLIKLKFSVFDKDFDYNYYKDQEMKAINNLRIMKTEKSAKDRDLLMDKRLQKLKMSNELKIRDSLNSIHKKIILNKLKKKKYIELLNETYKLLDKATVEYLTSVDMLNERIKYIKKYYAVFIDLFNGKAFKLLDEKIKFEIMKSLEETQDNKDEKDENSDNNSKNDIKNESIISQKNLKSKLKLRYEEKVKMYREYTSIHKDINKEINNVKIKFYNIKDDLNNIISKAKDKIEKLHDESDSLKLIFKKISHKQINYYLKILKTGLDVRAEGLSWVIIRLIELNAPIDSFLFPEFLDNEQIEYIIQIAKYGYEINQLTIILDSLREKETGKKNTKLSIFGSLTEEEILSSALINKTEDNNSNNEFNLTEKYNNDNNLLKYMKSKSLSMLNSKIINEESMKFQLEKNIINLKLKESKKRISMIAIDKKYKINDKKEKNKNNIDKFLLIQNFNNKSKYFSDILRIIEQINNLNNLIKDRREKELKNFGEKFKSTDLKDETAKTNYNKSFNALFGNAAFYVDEK